MKYAKLFNIGIIVFFILLADFDQASAQKTSIESVKKHLQFLASDTCEGRGTGSNGEKIASKYISDQLKKTKLQPLGDNNTYFQNILMHGSFPLKETDLKLYSDSSVYSLKINDDYLLYKTGASTFVPAPLPLVFVGYGIIAPEYDYNDYQNVNVEGKIVVFLSGEPHSNDPGYFNGKMQTIYGNQDSKQRTAISRGAAGSVTILNPYDNINMDWSYWKRQFQFEDISLTYSVSANLSILLNPEIAKSLFSSEKFTLDQIFEMHQKKKMICFNLNSKLSIKSFYKERDFIAQNVLALLEGNDPNYKDSYLLLSAHYDHLGIGPAVNGDSIYNGAFDNAMGVSVLLEIARVLSTERNKIKRSIIFLFTTGEEKGLLGSTYYAGHPKKLLHKTIANINIDGISCFDETNSFIGLGLEYSNIGKFFDLALSHFSLQRDETPGTYLMEPTVINRSDHFAFAKAGIPFIITLEGIDYRNTTNEAAIQRFIQWQENIYHTPFDDLNQTINYAAIKQHSNLILKLSEMIANSDDPPKWNSSAPFLIRRLQSIAEKR